MRRDSGSCPPRPFFIRLSLLLVGKHKQTLWMNKVSMCRKALYMLQRLSCFHASLSSVGFSSTLLDLFLYAGSKSEAYISVFFIGMHQKKCFCHVLNLTNPKMWQKKCLAFLVFRSPPGRCKWPMEMTCFTYLVY